MSGLCDIGDWTQSFVYTGQELYQLSSISRVYVFLMFTAEIQSIQVRNVIIILPHTTMFSHFLQNNIFVDFNHGRYIFQTVKCLKRGRKVFGNYRYIRGCLREAIYWKKYLFWLMVEEDLHPSWQERHGDIHGGGSTLRSLLKT